MFGIVPFGPATGIFPVLRMVPKVLFWCMLWCHMGTGLGHFWVILEIHGVELELPICSHLVVETL